jgi:hypothetical protein
LMAVASRVRVLFARVGEESVTEIAVLA